MPDSSRATGDFEDIDSAELKTQLKKWIEEEGIEANLQLQMKRNLIEKMSRTTLGKKIDLKLKTQQGIVLSPLVLVLNTLVAEFLYTQNCHFSLSIFTNEVPFKNTLPDFTRSPKFRLNRNELGEIFVALGIEHYGGLVEKYQKFGTEQGSRSLLYIVFKSILTSVKAQETKLRRLHRADRRKANAQTLLKQLEVEKLHRNVEKLLHRVKTVGKGITQLEESQRQQQHAPAASADGLQSKGEDEEPPSLRMCSENVSRLVERLESCTKMFEQLIAAIQQQSNKDRNAEKASNDEDDGEASEPKRFGKERKTYTEFLRELKTSEHGKKYVAKLQKQVSQLLDKEKSHLKTKYMKRLEKLELEYKEKCEKAICPKPAEPAALPSSRTERPNFAILESRDDESQHFMQKIDEKLDQLYQQERTVDHKLTTLRNDLQKQEQRQSSYFQSLKAAKTKESKLQVLHSVERELLATFEDETNAIIQNAKQTIEQLEKESDKINHSFQRHLQKQREDKRKLINEKVQIWTRYNDEKLELNQREFMDDVSGERNVDQHRPPATMIGPEVVVPVQIATDGTQFENPFRSFDPLKYLKRSRPIESYMVDVAIATSSDVGQQTSPDDSPIKGTTRPIPAARSKNYNEKLSDTLAKDTKDLRRSIEGNLQKLDQMSRSYSKPNSGSCKNAVGLKAYDVNDQANESFEAHAQLLRSVKPTSNRSLDDCSSAEFGLSDGEIGFSHARNDQGNGGISPQQHTTREHLDYTSQNKINEQADGQLLNIMDPPQPAHIAVSLSDLSISSVSVASQFSYEKSRSLDRELDRISIGARSNVSENSWT